MKTYLVTGNGQLLVYNSPSHKLLKNVVFEKEVISHSHLYTPLLHDVIILTLNEAMGARPHHLQWLRPSPQFELAL